MDQIISGSGRVEEQPRTLDRRAFLGRGAAAGVAVGLTGSVTQGCEGGSQASDERSQKVILDMQTRVQSPKLWNPLVPGFQDPNGFQATLMEPLFILNYASGEIEPWLGVDFTPNKALDTWTLKLRKGVKWSDGEDYDADDIVFTIELLRDGPAELLNAVAVKEWVKTVTKLDRHTVEFGLTKPNPRFQLDYFSIKIYRSIPIVPEHIWRGKDPLTFTNYDTKKGWPVFTGPYKLASVSPTRFVWERDPAWWGVKAEFKPLPEPEVLEWVTTETEDVRVRKAAKGQLDQIDDMTTGAYKSLHGRNEEFISWNPDEPYSWPDPCTRLLSLNNAAEPWDDPDMRWAVNYAIDKDEIVRIAYEGSTTKARFMFPPYTALERYVDLLEAEGLFEEYPILEHNPRRAAKLLRSKGYEKGGDGFYQKGGSRLGLRIIVPKEGTELERCADVIAGMLRKFGINAGVRRLDFSAVVDRMSKGDFEASLDFFACGSVSEPWSSMHQYEDHWVVPVGKDAEDNEIRWKNPVYSENVAAMKSLPLGDKRIDKHFVAAGREWLRDLPFIPAAHAKKLYAFNHRYWTGWPSADNAYVHPPMVWGSSHKIIHNLRRA